MIFVDSNLFVIDLRYPDDRHYDLNRRALDRLARRGLGVTSLLNVLEVCGILSFNLSATSLIELYVHFARRYGIAVVPGSGFDNRLPSPSAREVLTQMEHGMALKDAEIALMVTERAPALEAFLSWNAKHFTGKLPIPALTPRQWLSRSKEGKGRR